MLSKRGLLRYTNLCRRDVDGLDVSNSEVGQRIRDELEETRRQFHALLSSLSAADWDAPVPLPVSWTREGDTKIAPPPSIVDPGTRIKRKTRLPPMATPRCARRARTLR